jgi:fatty acid desaturase
MVPIGQAPPPTLRFCLSGRLRRRFTRTTQRCASTWLATRTESWQWGGIALASTWVAGRLGNRPCAIFIRLLLLAAVLLNISMLPYHTWFKIAMPVVIAAAAVCGYIHSTRRKSAAAPS